MNSKKKLMGRVREWSKEGRQERTQLVRAVGRCLARVGVEERLEACNRGRGRGSIHSIRGVIRAGWPAGLSDCSYVSEWLTMTRSRRERDAPYMTGLLDACAQMSVSNSLKKSV